MKKETAPPKHQQIFPLQWHVTNKCGQQCRHCYIYNKDGSVDLESEPDLDEARRVVDDFILFCRATNRRPRFVITGGDPLLYPYFWDLLTYAHKKEISSGILGNPFLLTPEICRRLASLGCTHYQVSLDGLEKTHD